MVRLPVRVNRLLSAPAGQCSGRCRPAQQERCAGRAGRRAQQACWRSRHQRWRRPNHAHAHAPTPTRPAAHIAARAASSSPPGQRTRAGVLPADVVAVVRPNVLEGALQLGQLSGQARAAARQQPRLRGERGQRLSAAGGARPRPQHAATAAALPAASTRRLHLLPATDACASTAPGPAPAREPCVPAGPAPRWSCPGSRCSWCGGCRPGAWTSCRPPAKAGRALETAPPPLAAFQAAAASAQHPSNTPAAWTWPHCAPARAARPTCRNRPVGSLPPGTTWSISTLSRW